MVNDQPHETPDYNPYSPHRPMEEIAGPYQDIVAGFQSTMADICSEFESTLAEATEAMKDLLKDVDGIDPEEVASAVNSGTAWENGKNAASGTASLRGEQSHPLRVFDK